MLDLDLFKAVLDYGALGVALFLVSVTLKTNNDRRKRDDVVTDKLIAMVEKDATSKTTLAEAIERMGERVEKCPHR